MEQELSLEMLARSTTSVALTREDRIALYLGDDAEIKLQVERLNAKRADLKALLQEIGEDAFELWYLQKHGQQMAGFRQKEMKRIERRAAMEDRQRSVEQRRARITPEAQAKLQARIAELKQHTRDEERKERQARMRGEGDLLE